jgi:cytochrome c peroxidase
MNSTFRSRSCRSIQQAFRLTLQHRRSLLWAVAIPFTLSGGVAVLHGQIPYFDRFLPNGIYYPNPAGASQTYSTNPRGLDMTGPFFQSLGSNGRSCASCHQPSDGMSVSAANVELRYRLSHGTDPIFRTVDGANCNHDIDVSTRKGKESAYSLLRTRGLFRIFLTVPATADYVVTNVRNQYGCNETDSISMYRRPLPTTNLRFLSAVMFDGRESSPATGTTKIAYANYPDALTSDLEHQALDAVIIHAEGDGTRPTAAEQQQIVDFETGLATAQAFGYKTGPLDGHGATGGPRALFQQPFFVSINSSVHPLVPTDELPGGLDSPGDGVFTPSIFNPFDAWSKLPKHDPRASVARGEELFNSLPINITGVAGINDDVAAGGLVAGGIPSLTGTCGTCHDTPNVGNHSFPTPLNIGTGDPDPANAYANLGGIDISYLPSITVCQKDPQTGLPTSTCKTTTDLGQALVDGNFAHVGKIKGPILRGLAARAPYFHNGSAKTLLDAVKFYETRFNLTLTPRQEQDLVAFLESL